MGIAYRYGKRIVGYGNIYTCFISDTATNFNMGALTVGVATYGGLMVMGSAMAWPRGGGRGAGVPAVLHHHTGGTEAAGCAPFLII